MCQKNKDFKELMTLFILGVLAIALFLFLQLFTNKS